MLFNSTSIGTNCFLVENRKNGFLVCSLDEWFKAFEKLYLDEELRKKMAKNNFEKIEDEFNYDKNCKNYLNTIEKV